MAQPEYERPSGPASAPAIRVVGVLLALPALAALAYGYIRPAVWTVLESFRQGDPITRQPAEWVGLDNYTETTGDAFGAFGLALAVSLVPVVLLALMAPLAFAASRAGLAGRWIARLALTLPIVCFTPTALGIAWYLSLDPESRRNGFIFALTLWLSIFGLVCGIAVTLYLAAFRRDAAEPGWAGWRSAGVVASLLALATVAAFLQLFDYARGAAFGGRENSFAVQHIFEEAFLRFSFGRGAAISTLLLAVLGLLGIGATIIVILTGLRVEMRPRQPAEGQTMPAALIVTIIGVVIVAAVALLGLWPWLSRAGNTSPDLPISVGTMLANTWLPPLLSTVVSVGLAAFAGFGIGALRPLGRRSELLLLPFAPFLFVGVGPLMVAAFDSTYDAELGNTFLGLIPPGWISVPALVIFTVFFRGQQLRHSPATPGAMALRVLLPALPLIGLVGLGTWVVAAQDLLWPLVIGADEDHWTAPVVLLLHQEIMSTAEEPPLGLPLPLAVVAALAVILGVLQVTYLDRLAIRVGSR